MTNDWHAAVLRFVCKGEERFPRHLVDGPGVKHARTGFPNETAVGTMNVTNAADARAVVATLQQQGADFMKVYNQVPREAFFALADEAKHRSMPIIGHVPWSVTVAEASNAGQRS